MIYSIVQNKGGVGKSTLCINFAECLAKFGKKVLIVDTDAQANSTSYFGIEQGTLYDSMVGDDKTPLQPVTTVNPNIFIVPADLRLSDCEYSLSQRIAREQILANKLEPLKKQYDCIVIDTAPNLGVLTINAILSADALLIPIVPEPFSIQGFNMINNMLSRLSAIRKTEIPYRLIMTRTKNTALHKETMEQMKNAYGNLVLDTRIKESIGYAEQSLGQGAKKNTYEYLSLTDEILKAF